MKLVSLRIFAALVLVLGIGQSATVLGGPSTQPLFFTPSSPVVPEVLAAFNSARKSIHMIMFRISVPELIDALIAAKKRGVDVRIIVDKNAAEREKPTGAFARLTAAGVTIVKSSSAFSLSHIKTFVIDNQTAYIMTLNLTRLADVARDVGYVTSDPETVNFFTELFDTDMQNAANKTQNSPPRIPEHVVLSPVNSRDKLVKFIGSAKRTIQLVVENFSDKTITEALIAAHKRGVKVEVLMPRCNFTGNEFDMPVGRTLAGANIDTRMMGAPMSAQLPYIHQKSIVVDEKEAYIGSENFTYNSLDRAREFGVIIEEAPQVRQLVNQFRDDFPKAMNMKDAETYKCPPKMFDDPTATPVLQ